MADISISKSRGKKYIGGASPMVPAYIVGENPNPLNPPGTVPTTLYKLLGDVTDTDFIGKNGRVPVVNDENVLTLEPLPQLQENGLISGGIVQWTGIGFEFNVSRAIDRFNQVLLDSLTSGLVTLAASDPTNNRRDVFILQVGFDGAGTPISITPDKITGTPSASPIKPQINPATQIELTDILVIAASTTPTLTTEVIYDQNIEWTGSSTGIGTVSFNSAVNPFQGSLSIESTNIENGLKIRLTDTIDYDLSTVQTLGLQIDLKASMGAGQNIGVTFLNSSGSPISTELILNHDKSLLGYQFVGIALSQFSFTSFLARSIEFRYIRTKGTIIYSGFFLDIIKLEGGINPPHTVGSFTGLNDTPNSYTGQAGKSVAVKSDESGLEFVTGGGGASTFLALTDTPSTYVAQANKFPRVNVGETALAFDTVSPYDLDQEAATDGQVLTWVNANSRYEPVTPSGGGGNFIAYDVPQSLIGSHRQQALDNIGSSAGSVETFTNSGVVTINDLVITKSNIEFRGTSTVTLNGMVALWMGQEVTIYNETVNNLTITLNNAGSTSINRFQSALVIPNRTFVRVKYTALGGSSFWVITSNTFFITPTGVGSYTLSSVGIGQQHEASVGLTVKTVGTVALRVNNLAGTVRLFEVQNSFIQSNVGHGFGGINPSGLTMMVKPLSYNICIRFTDVSNNAVVDLMGNGNYQSKGGAFFGSSNTGFAPSGRVDIRGIGTTTNVTLLLEDSAGTDNVKFIDNGHIQFLRLPTSSAGLVAGSLWNNAGVINII